MGRNRKLSYKGLIPSQRDFLQLGDTELLRWQITRIDVPQNGFR